MRPPGAPTMAAADFCTITAHIAAGRAVRMDDVAASFFDTQRAARHGAGSWYPGRTNPGHVVIRLHRTRCRSPQLRHRELSVHKRRIYRRRRTGGLCRHVPACFDSLGLDYAVSLRRLAHLHSGFLQTIPRRIALAVGWWLRSLSMSPIRFSHRGLSPHKFAPMLGAHG